MRAASEAPSRPCERSASGGVPQAGQPSTPRRSGHVEQPASARRKLSPSAPTGAWSSTTTSVALVGHHLREPVGIDAVEPREVDHPDAGSPRPQVLGGDKRLVQHHGAVREDERLVALARSRAAPGPSA